MEYDALPAAGDRTGHVCGRIVDKQAFLRFQGKLLRECPVDLPARFHNPDIAGNHGSVEIPADRNFGPVKRLHPARVAQQPDPVSGFLQPLYQVFHPRNLFPRKSPVVKEFSDGFLQPVRNPGQNQWFCALLIQRSFIHLRPFDGQKQFVQDQLPVVRVRDPGPVQKTVRIEADHHLAHVKYDVSDHVVSCHSSDVSADACDNPSFPLIFCRRFLLFSRIARRSPRSRAPTP